MITMDSIFNAFLITLFICAGFCIVVFVITMIVFKLNERKNHKEFDERKNNYQEMNNEHKASKLN